MKKWAIQGLEIHITYSTDDTEPAGKERCRGKKKSHILILQEIRIKFSSGEKTPRMLERMVGMQCYHCSWNRRLTSSGITVYSKLPVTPTDTHTHLAKSGTHSEMFRQGLFVD